MTANWLPVVLVCSFLPTTGPLPGQTPAAAAYRLAHESVQLNLRVGDLLAFMEAQQNNTHEYEITGALVNIASMGSDWALAASDILSLYALINTPTSKVAAQRVVTASLDRYAKFFREAATLVNTQLAYTNIPAIADSAGKLRDHFRQVESYLSSLPLK